MLSALGALIGFLSSIAPEIFRVLQDRRDKQHELLLLERQISSDAASHLHRMTEIDAQADIAESHSMLALTKVSTGIRWIDGLRGSVRPIITYAFFGMYCTTKLAQYLVLIDPALPWQSSMSYEQAIIALWNAEDMALFSGIMAFWFTNRGIEKARKHSYVH